MPLVEIFYDFSANVEHECSNALNTEWSKQNEKNVKFLHKLFRKKVIMLGVSSYLTIIRLFIVLIVK